MIKIGNNKTSGKKYINAELIRYTSKENYREVSNILNGMCDSNDDEVKLGIEILLSLWINTSP